MEIKLKPGKYVVAVSGGVDSVVLLDILSKQPDAELVVAHFNHGIRADSEEDEKFVAELAKNYGLAYARGEGRLGPDASEAKARSARYKFLKSIQAKHKADAIVTAHHQDDLVETAVLNLLRGTGRKGLSSLKSRPGVLRPLLDVPKKELIGYAKKNKLKWREDPSNVDTKYFRNYIRHKVLPHVSSKERNTLLAIIKDVGAKDREIDRTMHEMLDTTIHKDAISRAWLTSLPHSVAKELIADWLRKHAIPFDAPTVERLTVGLKTLPNNKKLDAGKGWHFEADEHTIRLKRPE